MDDIVGLSLPLWSKVEYFNNYWMYCHEILYRWLWSPADESYRHWQSPDLSSGASLKFTCSEITNNSWTDCQRNHQVRNVSNILVYFHSPQPDFVFSTNSRVLNWWWTLLTLHLPKISMLESSLWVCCHELACTNNEVQLRMKSNNLDDRQPEMSQEKKV